MNLLRKNNFLKSKKRKQTGFTLIEILIASYIFLIVIISGTSIFTSTVNAKLKANAMWATQQEGRLLLEQIIDLAKESKVKGVMVGGASNERLYLCADKACTDILYQILLFDNRIRVIRNPLTDPYVYYLNAKDKIEVMSFIPKCKSSSVLNAWPFLNLELKVQSINSGRRAEQDIMVLRTTYSWEKYIN